VDILFGASQMMTLRCGYAKGDPKVLKTAVLNLSNLVMKKGPLVV